MHRAIADGQGPELKCRRTMHFSLHPCIIVSQIEIPRSDQRKGRGPDFPQLARPAQSDRQVASDWNRLQGRYLPLIERWLGRLPGLGDESADLAKEELGLSGNAVILAKARVLKRLG
jgi:hypothetical protein